MVYSSELQYQMRSKIDPLLQFRIPKNIYHDFDSYVVWLSRCSFNVPPVQWYYHFGIFGKKDDFLMCLISSHDSSAPGAAEVTTNYWPTHLYYLTSYPLINTKKIRSFFNTQLPITLIDNGSAGAAGSLAAAQAQMHSNWDPAGSFATYVSDNGLTIIECPIHNQGATQVGKVKFYHFNGKTAEPGRYGFPIDFKKRMPKVQKTIQYSLPVEEDSPGLGFEPRQGYHSVVFQSTFLNIPQNTWIESYLTQDLAARYPNVLARLVILQYTWRAKKRLLWWPLAGQTEYVDRDPIDIPSNYKFPMGYQHSEIRPKVLSELQKWEYDYIFARRQDITQILPIYNEPSSYFNYRPWENKEGDD